MEPAAFRLAQFLLKAVLAVPVLDRPLAAVLFGGVALGARTRVSAYLLHSGCSR